MEKCKSCEILHEHKKTSKKENSSNLEKLKDKTVPNQSKPRSWTNDVSLEKRY